MQNEEEGQVQPAHPNAGRVPSTAFTAETAAEAGRLSGEARARARDMTPEERVWYAVDQQLPKLARELCKAALGEGDFRELKLETRVTALKTVLEMRFGKAKTAAAASPTIDEDGQVPAAPEDLFEN